MSFSEEKMMILKMLQDGKINTEEAAKLLEALEGGSRQAASGNTSSRPQRPQINYNDEIVKMRERINEWKNDMKKNYNEKDFDRMVDEFSTKAEKIGKNVAATTVGFVDKMIDFVGSVVDTGNFNIFGSLNAVEKVYEAEAAEGMNIDLEGVNGQILVKKHQDNKVVIKSTIKSSLSDVDNVIAYSNEGNSVSLKVNKTPNLSVSHEVYIPAVKFNRMKFETSNGRLYIEDSISNEFESVTKNASIDLMGVNSDKISVNTKNAKISINYVTGKDIDINTNNSLIDVKNVKAGKLSAVTTNGKIFVESVQNIDDSSEAFISLKTTNGDIKANMNDMDNKAFKVKAQTTNGKVNLLIPELLYHSPSKVGYTGGFVEAETNGYDTNPQKVNINAETVNGYIEIVK